MRFVVRSEKQPSGLHRTPEIHPDHDPRKAAMAIGRVSIENSPEVPFLETGESNESAEITVVASRRRRGSRLGGLPVGDKRDYVEYLRAIGAKHSL
jgi:hypothetical protein